MSYPERMKRWGLIMLPLLAITGCGGPSIGDVRTCLSENIEVAREAGITDEGSLEAIMDASKEDCGYYDLSDAERADLVD